MPKLTRLQHLTVTAFGLGRLPGAPGTYGAALAAAIGMGVSLTPPSLFHVEQLPYGFHFSFPTLLCVLLSLATFSLSVRLAPCSEVHFGESDPGEHVIDEVSGQFLSLGLVFLLPGGLSPFGVGLSFALFRFFDIAKPPPVRRVERIGGGWGVSLDDILAGVYAGVCGVVVVKVLGF